MTRKQKKLLWRILAAGVLFGVALAVILLLHPAWYVGIALMLVPYLLVGYDVLWGAVQNIVKGKVFDEHFLMTVASLGAFLLCLVEKDAHEAHEAVVILLFYQVGELFQSVAVGRSRKSLESLLSMMPEYANVMRDGKMEQVDPAELSVGDVILVLPGERVPLDGVVLRGTSFLDTASLTGESVPRQVTVGEQILSGCINGEGVLEVQVLKPFEESTVSKILELVENAGMHKAKSEKFISSFARRYTPAVTLSALFLGVVLPIVIGFVSGDWSFDGTWYPFVHASLMFLIVSCPCALVISVPMSFFGGIGGASKKGILIKGSGHLETLSKCTTIAFDKTGTLTRGDFSVTELCPAGGVTSKELLSVCAAAERHSTHPLALAVLKAAEGMTLPAVTEHKNIPGRGVQVLLDGKGVFVGNGAMMKELGVDVPDRFLDGSVLHVAREGAYLGAILVKDTIKEDAEESLAALKKLGIKTVMLTGDRAENAKAVAQALHIDHFKAELLPTDKVTAAEALLKEQVAGGRLAFVGDGINDAPVLALSDVGIAMGALGSDAAIEAADVVLMNDRLADVVTALEISAKTMRIVRQNIIFAIGVKVAVMVLLALMAVIPALAPFAPFAGTFAVFADVGVSVIAILNAMRAMRV
ncbi:MAG: heavy metal translocating P-type ATPase [Clostridia bacterium]|nr:heavy metal translocating P-type ATPase [Clostridia bacterium]